MAVLFIGFPVDGRVGQQALGQIGQDRHFGPHIVQPVDTAVR
jgi:hypothetical protein